jgi:hypothetical protein
MFNFLSLLMNPNKYRIACGEYQLSIIYGIDNYCGNDTVEIAVMVNGYCIIPDGMESFYSGDTVIGWQNEDQVKVFCAALCTVAGVEYTEDMDAQISTIFAERV